MRFVTQKRKRTPTVIIVSLIDVLLVVLIFLMVTTTAKKKEPVLKLNLPQSKEAKQGSSEVQPFIVQVTTNFPYFFVGDRPVTLDRLQSELAAAVKKDPKLQVAVKADRGAPFGEIVRIIDASKAAQVGSLNFLTEKQSK
ncbi:MAG TPA: biopolymer transporter ExbD [Candidatus Saccharimonadales bacterium]|nr:biopolymer transporter ExbD [Candidatus Saccharimonadales bacterium]